VPSWTDFSLLRKRLQCSCIWLYIVLGNITWKAIKSWPLSLHLRLLYIAWLDTVPQTLPSTTHHHFIPGEPGVCDNTRDMLNGDNISGMLRCIWEICERSSHLGEWVIGSVTPLSSLSSLVGIMSSLDPGMSTWFEILWCLSRVMDLVDCCTWDSAPPPYPGTLTLWIVATGRPDNGDSLW
jgi:hypothetical protein